MSGTNIVLIDVCAHTERGESASDLLYPESGKRSVMKSQISMLRVRSCRDEDEGEALCRIPVSLGSPDVRGLAKAWSPLLADEPARAAIGEAALTSCFPGFDIGSVASRDADLCKVVIR